MNAPPLRDPAGRAPSAWILTDAKAGDEEPCLGVAEALAMAPEIRRVAPRPPYSWLAPWGPVDPREAPGRAGPLAPPFPDLVLASGRRAVPYLRAIKRASGGRTFTVFLKDPRTGARTADLIWVPEHDDLQGLNVIRTLTSPHRVSAARLAAARASPDPRLDRLARPRVAVLAGGHSRHLRFGEDHARRLARLLTDLAGAGASLMITPSRRTPPVLQEELARVAAAGGGFLWDGSGQNPYLAMLALAEAVVVTADSVNMVGEATATGVPVLLFDLPGGHPRHRRFLRGLQAHGAVKPFTGCLEAYRYEPLNATPAIAAAIAAGVFLSRPWQR